LVNAKKSQTLKRHSNRARGLYLPAILDSTKYLNIYIITNNIEVLAIQSKMRPQSSVLLLFTIITFTLLSSFASAQTILKKALQGNTCTYDIIPSAPRNLILIPKDSVIEAKWWTPSNKPCEVIYEVVIFEAGGVRKAAAMEVKETKATLTGLRNDLKYDIIVTVRNFVDITSKVYYV
jgi:hypothetical protein